MLRLAAAFLAIVAFSFCVALPYSIFHDGGVLHSSGFQLVLKSFGMVLMGSTGHSTGRHFLEKIGNDLRLLSTALCTQQLSLCVGGTSMAAGGSCCVVSCPTGVHYGIVGAAFFPRAWSAKC